MSPVFGISRIRNHVVFQIKQAHQSFFVLDQSVRPPPCELCSSEDEEYYSESGQRWNSRERGVSRQEYYSDGHGYFSDQDDDRSNRYTSRHDRSPTRSRQKYRGQEDDYPSSDGSDESDMGQLLRKRNVSLNGRKYSSEKDISRKGRKYSSDEIIYKKGRKYYSDESITKRNQKSPSKVRISDGRKKYYSEERLTKERHEYYSNENIPQRRHEFYSEGNISKRRRRSTSRQKELLVSKQQHYRQRGRDNSADSLTEEEEGWVGHRNRRQRKVSDGRGLLDPKSSKTIIPRLRKATWPLTGGPSRRLGNWTLSRRKKWNL